jgi:hypothetical protein
MVQYPMKYPASLSVPILLNTSSLLFRRGCRLLVLSFAAIPHRDALFSTACSLFSQNTRVGVPLVLRLSALLFEIAALSPLSVVFTPNSPLSSLSTVFTHCDRGTGASETQRRGAGEEKTAFSLAASWNDAMARVT